MTYKPTLLVDFDGVIHSYASGWKGEAVIPDPPVPGAFDFLDKALDDFQVAIYSSRSKTKEGLQAMKAWFRVHGFVRVTELGFPAQKPPAFLTIDDRALCFTGVWPSIDEIKTFKPWYQK